MWLFVPRSWLGKKLMALRKSCHWHSQVSGFGLDSPIFEFSIQETNWREKKSPKTQTHKCVSSVSVEAIWRSWLQSFKIQPAGQARPD
jgi:hypothetical protein